MDYEAPYEKPKPYWYGYPELYEVAFALFDKPHFLSETDWEGNLHKAIELDDCQLAIIQQRYTDEDPDRPDKITLLEEVQPSYDEDYYEMYNSFNHRLIVLLTNELTTTMYAVTTKRAGGNQIETLVRKEVASTEQTQSIQESAFISLGMLNPFAKEDPLDGEIDMGNIDEMEAQQLVALLKSINQVITQ